MKQTTTYVSVAVADGCVDNAQINIGVREVLSFAGVPGETAADREQRKKRESEKDADEIFDVLWDHLPAATLKFLRERFR